MLFKKRTLVLLALVVGSLLACKKNDPISPTPTPVVVSPVDSSSPYESLEGYFYVERIGSSLYSSSSGYFNTYDTADLFLETRVVDDSLVILDWRLPIDSVGQRVFTFSATYLSRLHTTTVYFNSDYSYLEVNYDNGYVAGQSRKAASFKGNRALKGRLPNSGSLYTLAVTRKNTTTNIDTQYTGDIVIEHRSGSALTMGDKGSTILELDGEPFSVGTFFTHYQERKDHSTREGYIKHYWKNDSFSMEKLAIEYNNLGGSPTTPDTTYHYFRGRKR